MLAVVPVTAQVQANFFPQAGVTIGQYQQYVVQVCNGADGPAEIQGGAIWEMAKTRGPFIAQLTSVVMRELDYGSKISRKAWALRIVSWSAAGVSGLVASKAVGNLSLNPGPGKAILAAAPTISLALGLAAESVAKVPEKEIDVGVDAILPGTVKLGAHDCSPQYVMWGVPMKEL